LGDEVGTLNHHAYLDNPDQAGDSRWVHRPPRDAARYAQRTDPATVPGQVFGGLKRLIELRQRLPALGGLRLTGFRTHNPHVLGYLRGEGAERLLVLANFSEHAQACSPVVFSAGPSKAADCISGEEFRLEHGLHLAPYQVVWLRYP
jgi:amylosucrase